MSDMRSISWCSENLWCLPDSLSLQKTPIHNFCSRVNVSTFLLAIFPICKIGSYVYFLEFWGFLYVQISIWFIFQMLSEHSVLGRVKIKIEIL